MVENNREKEPKTVLSPTALLLDDAARLLTRSGGIPVTREMIQTDIDDGAPLNADGTLNLVHYAAWLVKDMAGAAGKTHGD